ncbi:methionyl-tRNA formyltransferase [soil metagenome]
MDQVNRIIFAGSGEFGIPSLEALLRGGYEVVQVVSQPDRPAGRGRALTPTPIASLAASRDLPLLKTASINAETLPPADLMIFVVFGQKVAPHLVEHAWFGAVNLHASILPRYRGAAPINWAIIRGETETGNSIIRLAQRMDAGPVLAQSRLAIGELETAGELHDRLAADGGPLLSSLVQKMAAGMAVEAPQDETLATLAPKLSREASRLDFTRPAAELANQVRGMFPWPGCRVRVVDEQGAEHARVTLVRARAVEGSGTPGTISESGNIHCGGGSLEVVELQPQGKRPMSLAAFCNGHRWEPRFRAEPTV